MLEIKPLASSSAGNCTYISDGQTALLLDAGLRFSDLQKALSFRISELKGALASHEHFDHCRALKDLIKAGLDIYAASETIKALELNGHRTHTIEPLKQFRIGTWTVKPFDTPHDVPALGFLLQSKEFRVLYLTDTPYCRYKFERISHLLVEANYSLEILKASSLDPEVKKRIIRNHMSIEGVKEFLKANDLSQLREIWLLHLSDGNSDADRFKKDIQSIVGVPCYIAEK